MTRASALALLLLASCATAPEPKRSTPVGQPLKPAAQTAPASRPATQAAPVSRLSVQPAVQKDPGTLDVKPVQLRQDSLTAHCKQVPLPANCVPPPSGEEVVFGMPTAPPPAPVPTPPWYVSLWRWLWPWAGAAVKDSNPPKDPAPAPEAQIPPWRQVCIDNYAQCVGQVWVQKWSCNDCLHYCIAQRVWPQDFCYAPWQRKN